MRSTPGSLRSGMLLVLLFVAAQTAYAMWLNHVLYQRFSPFFDSMAYAMDYATILTLARESGIWAALRQSFHSGTVSLPWILTALFSPILPMSRLTGIWFQEIWVLTLGLALFWYLHRYRRLPTLLAVCYTLPLLAFRAVFMPNGGVSDFRMDLFLYLLLGNMTVWYLITYETESVIPWTVSGLFLLLATLARATAPAYIAVMFGPLLLTRPRILWKPLVFWLPPAALAMIALVANYEQLRFYYFIWGADPNANLPLRQSLLHFERAGESIGLPLTVVAIGMAIVQIMRQRQWRFLDWRLAWLGMAPALLLALRGAGLNPFVSMPSVFGGLLFCMLPFRNRHQERPNPLCAALLVAACVVSAVQGGLTHRNPAGIAPGMAAMKQAIGLMHDDALQSHKPKVSFATAHSLDFGEAALRNVLVYDFGAALQGTDYVYDGIRFRVAHNWEFAPVVPLTWNNDITGATDDAKLTTLVNLALNDIDYFFLPDQPSLDWMERNAARNFINTKARAFQQKLLSTGRWESLGPPLIESPHETVQLFRKVR